MNGKICVSSTPEEMWRELQEERKLRDEGFDLNHLPKENVQASSEEDVNAVELSNNPQKCAEISASEAFSVNLSERSKFLLQKAHLGCGLSVTEQFEALEQPNATEILLAQAENQGLGNEVQLKVCELPDGKEILLTQILHFGLCNEAQLKVCEYPYAKVILLAQVLYHHGLCAKVQSKILKWPLIDAAHILSQEAEKHGLCAKAKSVILQLSNSINM